LKSTHPDAAARSREKLLPAANANKLSDFPDFNEPAKLGSGKEMVDRITNLISIFENPALDFSKNRGEGDDILGDAYEYLMRHFATESGKSKGAIVHPRGGEPGHRANSWHPQRQDQCRYHRL
jgi:type I restriction enzyme M protein